MEGKDRDELVLDDKLDAARTLVRLIDRQQQRRTLNEVETAIKQNHKKEVDSGSVTAPVFLSPAAILAALAPGAAIESGEEADSASSDDGAPA